MAAVVAIGIDRHKRTHTAVALDELGRELGSREITARSAGYLSMWRWAERLGEAGFAIEGTGS
jgi:transposase